MSQRVFDNLGITIDMREIPEFMAYHDYAWPSNRLVRWWRNKFRKEKIDMLTLAAQTAFLIKVLEDGKSEINERSPD